MTSTLCANIIEIPTLEKISVERRGAKAWER